MLVVILLYAFVHGSPSLLSPAEPVSVQCGRFGGGVVRQEEAVGSGGTGSYREWIQTGSRAQALIPTGISELKYLFSSLWMMYFMICMYQTWSIFNRYFCHSTPWTSRRTRIPNVSVIVFVLQLKPLPRAVAVRTVYEARTWSYQVQHGAVWGNQEFSLSGLYSAPPALETGNQTLKGKLLQTDSAGRYNRHRDNVWPFPAHLTGCLHQDKIQYKKDKTTKIWSHYKLLMSFSCPWLQFRSAAFPVGLVWRWHWSVPYRADWTVFYWAGRGMADWSRSDYKWKRVSFSVSLNMKLSHSIVKTFWWETFEHHESGALFDIMWSLPETKFPGHYSGKWNTNCGLFVSRSKLWARGLGRRRWMRPNWSWNSPSPPHSVSCPFTHCHTTHRGNNAAATK